MDKGPPRSQPPSGPLASSSSPTTKESSAAAAATTTAAVSFLEDALLQGVVPADAGVGENSLPGDFGFDPLHLATEDYIRPAQSLFWKLVPGASAEEIQKWNEPRQSALILRDYREAEIRHSRLAMLAATIWPLQEMLDRLLLDQDQFGSTTFVYGGVTLPYLTLVMTAVMMLLGYLDIYASTIKDVDDVGEAFLPGDCFWDPLSILEGAPATMKRNMQERELFNGRFAMIAVAFYIFEEATTHKPLITIPGNELLFEPAYLIPYIQQFLDSIFATPSPLFVFPDVGSVEEEEAIRTILQEGDPLYSQIP